MAEPFHVAGSGKMDLKLMQAAPGRIFVKTGAEGVYCGALPELGLGIAVKCDDGAGRAAEVVVSAVLGKLLAGDAELAARLEGFARYTLTNWNGMEVGMLRPTQALA
jgi:L-asparaginase II